MPAITLSIPQEVKDQMDTFSEINWSGFVKKAIIEKTKELAWKEEMLQKIKEENQLEKDSIELGRKLNKGVANKLKKDGLI